MTWRLSSWVAFFDVTASSSCSFARKYPTATPASVPRLPSKMGRSSEHKRVVSGAHPSAARVPLPKLPRLGRACGMAFWVSPASLWLTQCEKGCVLRDRDLIKLLGVSSPSFFENILSKTDINEKKNSHAFKIDLKEAVLQSRRERLLSCGSRPKWLQELS